MRTYSIHRIEFISIVGSAVKTLENEDEALRQDFGKFVRDLIKEMIRFLKVSRLLGFRIEYSMEKVTSLQSQLMWGVWPRH